MSVKETAIKYYPKLWKKERIIALVKADKITKDEYKEITGEEYAAS